VTTLNGADLHRGPRRRDRQARRDGLAQARQNRIKYRRTQRQAAHENKITGGWVFPPDLSHDLGNISLG
jgi:hypothetical protein